MKKKILSIILLGCMAVSLIGCGNTPNNDTSDNLETQNTETVNLEEANSEIITKPTDTKEEESQIKETEKEDITAEIMLPEYKMAQIGMDSRVSDDKYGIYKTGLKSYSNPDKLGVTYYALSWVLQEPEFQDKTEFKVNNFILKDAKTGEELKYTKESLTWKIYGSTIYNTENILESTYKLDKKKTFVFVVYSDYLINFEDIEVWCKVYDSNYNQQEIKLDFNASLDKIDKSPVKAEGSALVELNGNLYIPNVSSTGGGRGSGKDYIIYDFISVSKPLQDDKLSGNFLDTSKISFINKETGQIVTEIPGSSIYYDQKYNNDGMAAKVEIGILSENEELLDSWRDNWYVLYDGCLLI